MPGTGSGEGGPVSVYVDDVLKLTKANDGSNNPVFTPTGIPDVMYVGGNGALMDDVRIYDVVFSPAGQCTYVVGGVWSNGACTLP